MTVISGNHPGNHSGNRPGNSSGNKAQNRCVGLIGGGVIGSAWAARLLINGFDVKLYDPAPGVERRVGEVLDNALRAYQRMTLAAVSIRGNLRRVDSIEAAVSEVEFVQESGPERLDVKKALMKEIARYAPADTIIASSSSGLLPSEMQAGVDHPERILIGHPFNPVYLIPLVEIVGGDQTSDENKEKARAFYAAIGMHPLMVRKEVDAFIADRLMEALWREALHLLNEDVATADEIDQAIAYGPGLRWAFMGSFLTFRIAGGEGGMRHFMSQFAPTLKLPWARFEGPDLSDELLNKIVHQSDQQAAGRSILELEQKRDDCIVAIVQALRANDNAAGKVLARYEEQLYALSHQQKVPAAHVPPQNLSADLSADLSRPLALHSAVVGAQWVDYNNHATEGYYLIAMGSASGALFRFIGIDQDYRDGGLSFFSVETHIIHKAEIVAGERFFITTQIIDLDAKRLHLFHRMFRDSGGDLGGDLGGKMGENLGGVLVASGEQMLLHVNSKESKACAIRADIYANLERIFAQHQHLDRPQDAGRTIGIRRNPA